MSSDLDPVARAEAFIASVRAQQRRDDSRFQGAKRAEYVGYSSIRAVARQLCGSDPDSEQGMQAALVALMDRFEILCLAQRRNVDPALRRPIMEIFRNHLQANAEALGLTPQQVMPTTLYWGAIGPELKEEFAHVEKLRILQLAVIGMPANPRRHLRNYQLERERVKEIAAHHSAAATEAVTARLAKKADAVVLSPAELETATFHHPAILQPGITGLLQPATSASWDVTEFMLHQRSLFQERIILATERLKRPAGRKAFTLGPFNELQRRFDDVLRICGMPLTASQKFAAQERLADELSINHRAVSAAAIALEDLIPITVLHGAVLPELTAAFPQNMASSKFLGQLLDKGLQDPMGFCIRAMRPYKSPKRAKRLVVIVKAGVAHRRWVPV